MAEPNLEELAEAYRASAADYAARARSSEGLDRAFLESVERSYLTLAALMKQTAMDSAARLARAGAMASEMRNVRPEA